MLNPRLVNQLANFLADSKPALKGRVGRKTSNPTPLNLSNRWRNFSTQNALQQPVGNAFFTDMKDTRPPPASGIIKIYSLVNLFPEK
uniref:Uncharacterized protein n=1 Tax=Trichobilharzia regenti TaxID=157069 RepID=A0AA85KQN4_TRIRE|nr:unnamed protein product [Trichobilharzia regenti]